MLRLSLTTITTLTITCLMLSDARGQGNRTFFIWPDLAPGETERGSGEPLPMRPADDPPITRIEKIRRPPITVFPPTGTPNGVSVLILPGGGFVRVVPDLEGSEAAAWLGKLGVTSFVLNYRTNEAKPENEADWKRPLQDSQRAMRWIREHADRWQLDPQRVGLLAFSAGGQVGSMLITAENQAAYGPIDEIDRHSFRPAFSMLVYPWRIYDEQAKALLPQIEVSSSTPPTFLVHTHDDRSTSLGAVFLYADLKRHDVLAELHVYETGGHGYGTRDRPGSNIGSWTDRATDWLERRLPPMK